MKNTVNLNLKKPDYTDLADIGDVNSNMDIIDAEIEKIKDGYEPKLTIEQKRKITIGTAEPIASMGTDGDIYLQYE